MTTSIGGDDKMKSCFLIAIIYILCQVSDMKRSLDVIAERWVAAVCVSDL